MIAYDSNSSGNLDSLVWNIKMILQSGQVDLDNDAIVVSVIVANNTESSLEFNDTLIDESGFKNSDIPDGTYGKRFLNKLTDNEILDPGEICRFFVKLPIEIEANEMVIIIIFSGAAMLKVFKTAPTGINPGLNILR